MFGVELMFTAAMDHEEERRRCNVVIIKEALHAQRSVNIK
jgi:hypothetical protein